MEKKILFVDDEEDILEMLECLFVTEGYSIFRTTNGHEGLEILKREKIRVAFLDLRMPEIDGVELCRRIKEHDHGARVFALSAYVDAIPALDDANAGFEKHFRKPFNADEVLRAAAEAFEELEKK